MASTGRGAQARNAHLITGGRTTGCTGPRAHELVGGSGCRCARPVIPGVRCLLAFMSEVGFDELWRDLLRGEYKDGGYENIRQVIRYLAPLPENKRQAFLNELVSVGLNKSYGWGIALGVLESEATPEQIQRLCENVSSIRAEPEGESNLVYVLRVLAK